MFDLPWNPKRAAKGEIRSSGWETPAGWRHAAYVSWAVKARCHWLERRLKWEQNDENRAQESEHPRAKHRITDHFKVLYIIYRLAIRGICRCLDVYSRCWRLQRCHLLSPDTFQFFVLQMWAAGTMRPVRWVKRSGINHWSRWTANQCWQSPALQVYWTVITCDDVPR